MYSLTSHRSQSWLSWFLRGLLVLGFLILVSRLIDLQLIKGSYFRGLSDGNRIRRVVIHAPRGKILARGGEILVGNKEVNVEIAFDRTLGFTKKEVQDQSAQNLVVESKRFYPLGPKFAHAGGYIGEVNEDELGKIKGECPQKGARKNGDTIGRTGLEKQYDCVLFGVNGELLFEVDASNKTAQVLGKKDAIPGDDVRTTIDFDLQMKVSELMENQKGAVVVSGLNGEILAFFSGPSFDPNLFVSGNPTQLSNVLTNPELLLFNRVIGGAFHPGSVYKPLVGLAALEEKVIDENYTYQDQGQIVIKNLYGTFSYKNWYFTQYGGVEGNIGLKRALARSTDTFFYQIGELLGAEKISEWSEKFGLSKETGIDIPGEISGLVPNPDWKIERKGERWFLGDTYNVSIGQGDLAVTPIAINTMIAAIADSGKLCSPHFLQTDTTSCIVIGIENSNQKEVMLGMEDACKTGGTAFPFFDFYEKRGVKVACKTGTAQNVNEDPHAWFVAFAPSEKPEIFLTVLIENGGEGSKVAAPIAREIMDYYFASR